MDLFGQLVRRVGKSRCFTFRFSWKFAAFKSLEYSDYAIYAYEYSVCSVVRYCAAILLQRRRTQRQHTLFARVHVDGWAHHWRLLSNISITGQPVRESDKAKQYSVCISFATWRVSLWVDLVFFFSFSANCWNGSSQYAFKAKRNHVQYFRVICCAKYIEIYQKLCVILKPIDAIIIQAHFFQTNIQNFSAQAKVTCINFWKFNSQISDSIFGLWTLKKKKYFAISIDIVFTLRVQMCRFLVSRAVLLRNNNSIMLYYSDGIELIIWYEQNVNSNWNFFISVS